MKPAETQPSSQDGTLSTNVALACHAALYISQMVVSLGGPALVRYVAYSACFLLCAVSVFSWRNSGRIKIAFPLLLCAYVGFLACWGYFNDNWFSYWAADLAAFCLLPTFFMATDSAFVERMLSVYSRLLLPALICAFWGLLGLKFGGIENRFADGLSEGVYSIPAICFPGMVLAIIKPRLEVKEWGLVVLSLVVIFAFSFVTITRGSLVLALMGTGFIFIQKVRKNKILLGALLASLVGIGAMLAKATSEPETVQSAPDPMAAMEYRFRESEFSSGRIDESTAFLEETDGLDWWVGRGLGGAYFGLLGRNMEFGINMVHFGHLHLILKGGVVLLMLFALVVTRAFANTEFRKVDQRSAIFVVVLFMVSTSFHPEFRSSIQFAIFCVFLGRSLLTQEAAVLRVSNFLGPSRSASRA